MAAPTTPAYPPAPERDVIRIPILGRDAIVVGFHLTEYLLREVLTTVRASTFVLVTDKNLEPLYLDRFRRAFATLVAAAETSATSNGAKPPRLLTFVLPPGEQTKDRLSKAHIEDFMLAEACTRDTCLLALGGGVIGDLAGYVAATFMRGIPLVQIPTSLLAMVDSSIGGKTAIDTPHGKNLIGAFWQPHRVFIDLAFLATLPEREFYNGMAEVIKTATIRSESDFDVLETHPEAIRAAVLEAGQADETDDVSQGPRGARTAHRTPAQKLLLRVVMGSARVKAEVVSADERESGLRGLLNFGHTVGHAIEALAAPHLLHGECVALGMVLESEIARNLGHFDQVGLSRLVRCLKAYSLPVALDDARVLKLTCGVRPRVADMMRVMRVDKKTVGTTKRLALPSRIGATVQDYPIPVADNVIETVISSGVQVQPVAGTPAAPLHSGQEIVVDVPGSKSLSNRALVLAALGTGTCRLRNLLHSDDTQVMLSALEKLGGCSYTWEDAGRTLVVTGGAGLFHVPDVDLYLGNAGTAARFLTTLVTLVPPSPNNPAATTVLTGNARMKQRPIGPLVTALRANGTKVAYEESDGCLPLRVTPQVGGLAGGRIQLAASISSQYVSSILLCAPYAATEVILELTGGKVISQPYIDMTVAMMRSFGVDVERIAENVYRIPCGGYQNPPTYMVESDASSATYPLAVAAMTGSRVTIANIGHASLQGDARFAVDVLRPMGCEVTQSATATTVQGPPAGTLQPLPHVDMEPMTDAFLTASVLAAVAAPAGDDPKADANVTRITGIANQRVKECNRIAVMVEELGRFGVQASELPDGIQIHGRPFAQLRGPATGVHCHDDHRVAMSFSVLGCAVPGATNIQERKCVEKTWPNWWDALEHQLGVQLHGFDTHAAVAHDTTARLSPPGEATLVLIGMRGSGKTTLGRAAARALGRHFIDMDVHMEATLGRPVADVVSQEGWDAFRAHETRLLTEVLRAHPEGAVVACGGGIVETPEGRAVLEDYTATYRAIGRLAPVVHIATPHEHVEAYLARDTHRPAYGADLHTVWERRRPHYERLATFQFPVYVPTNATPGEHDARRWARVEHAFVRYLRFVTGRQAAQPAASAALTDAAARLPRFFVSLTLPDLAATQDQLARIMEGAGAVELRVDLLHDGSQASPANGTDVVKDLDHDFVRRQLALLRHHMPEPLPVIFTVRTRSQGGRFADDQPTALRALYARALAWGVEYLDVELGSAPTDLHPGVPDLAALLAARGATRVIASWHDPQAAVAWDSPALRAKYDSAANLGDIVKLVSVARTMDDNLALYRFKQSVQDQRPLVALNMGPAGQWSRVVCPYLTPVTHAALPTKAAPGQLTVAEIHRARHLLGDLPRREYFLFGSPIAHSPSPLLYNTGFAALGLPHHYGLAENESSATLAEIQQTNPHFGGGSVTIPLKEALFDLLDELSPEVKTIGAVNTIHAVKETDCMLAKTPGQHHRFTGDNTDWLGIVAAVQRAQTGQADNDDPRVPSLMTTSGLTQDTGSPSALIIGAGGTARAALYAVHRMGFQHVYLYNRTQSRAEALVTALNLPIQIEVVASLDAQSITRPLTFILSAIPATQWSLDLPETLFHGPAMVNNGDRTRQEGGVVALDMAYKPRRTPLLAAAAKHGWQTVEGVEVLIEQGLHQFRIYTGLPPPQEAMREAVLQAYDQ
ncbi:3-dehydroquinate dehydratase (3-dehydroquinase) [Tieghemiomyces parasiticus]|uniref:Pentafunctional AROM polypeptide n=1 Tax=Tieghemiomyces parasiticus TaxID=78921 RepID=A0A9W8E3E1_9FUNG|nr:3-dehydroquinate dehydratase (3-dehydroquinase) [Tieghemiomyces parasiticus]